MKERNKPIGTCPCPIEGCAKVMDVFQFRGRENVTQRRLAGKFYGQCDDHGRIGADGKQATIDYIAERMTWNDQSKATNAGAAPENQATRASEKPAQSTPAPANAPKSAPAKQAPPRRPNLWEL